MITPASTINEIADAVHANAIAHGFHPLARGLGTLEQHHESSEAMTTKQLLRIVLKVSKRRGDLKTAKEIQATLRYLWKEKP